MILIYMYWAQCTLKRHMELFIQYAHMNACSWNINKKAGCLIAWDINIHMYLLQGKNNSTFLLKRQQQTYKCLFDLWISI